MKKVLFTMLLIATVACLQSAAVAAELLDVKPIVNGTDVSVEITSDIAMTYTYYKVPGQARAVVDVAEADPEKVEPLIVVNKGIVASISVDKAQISGIVVSRIIFNLVSEADITVSAAADRKKLTVVFGGAAPAVKAEPKPEPKIEVKVEPKPEPVAEPAEKTEPPVKATTPKTAAKEEDPLGLDDPAAKAESVAAPAKTVAAAAATTAIAAVAAIPAPPVVTRVPKLEPVVPAAVTTARPSALTIIDVATGATYIDIRANQAITNYKTTKLSGPDRLVIDIPSEKVNQKAKTVIINKHGVAKARIGVSPKNVRVVIDSSKAGFPAHTITNIEDGLRITFK